MQMMYIVMISYIFCCCLCSDVETTSVPPIDMQSPMIAPLTTRVKAANCWNKAIPLSVHQSCPRFDCVVQPLCSATPMIKSDVAVADTDVLVILTTLSKPSQWYRHYSTEEFDVSYSSNQRWWQNISRSFGHIFFILLQQTQGRVFWTTCHWFFSRSDACLKASSTWIYSWSSLFHHLPHFLLFF